MEETLFSLNNLRNMEVIDFNKGKKLGFIVDVKIDCDDNKILSILIPEEKTSWFGKAEDIEIPWENVIKVGIDVILVRVEKDNKYDMDKYM
ncbi:MAG: YlmC/YmxH family sporulation protein [Clostridium perfringens]|nr:YlmC/YmxH family sporulation protein [Clostridium perfringens]